MAVPDLFDLSWPFMNSVFTNGFDWFVHDRPYLTFFTFLTFYDLHDLCLHKGFDCFFFMTIYGRTWPFFDLSWPFMTFMTFVFIEGFKRFVHDHWPSWPFMTFVFIKCFEWFFHDHRTWPFWPFINLSS